MTLEEIFQAALDKPDAASREAYLAKACSDAKTRHRVEDLLAAHFRSGAFLESQDGTELRDGSTLDKTELRAESTDDRTVTLSGDAAPSSKHSEDTEGLHFLAPTKRPDSLGRLGHYEMLQVLGKGGFGIVFRAFDDVLQRVVAVKVMAPQIAATSPARKRFLREARSSAAVRHENVVQVYEVVEQPLPYLVMEFIPGETLQEKLNRTGPLEVNEILRIGRQIAEGLAAAHATDLIHRDIKPGNVLIESGAQHRVKITDFGLARAADDASISQSGIIAGTPMYMAPEQAKGETLDQRADLFSLGSVLYQMAAGRPPFRANSTVAVLKRVAEETPRSIREIIPETPQWLCDIISKLHAKNPDDRFQSAREVAEVLADCEAQLKANAKLKDFSRIPLVKKEKEPRSTARWKGVALLVLILTLVYFAAGLRYGFFGRASGMVTLQCENPEARLVVVNETDGVMRELKPGDDRLDAGFYRVAVQSPPGRRVETVLVTEGILTREVEKSGFQLKMTRGDRMTIKVLLAPIELSSDGWTQLFNGRDLTGWKFHPEQPGNWRVEGGVLIGSDTSSYLFSDAGDYADFHLRVEARINRGGDSGVFFRSPFAMRPGRFAGTLRPAGGYEAEMHRTPGHQMPTGSIWNAESTGSPKPLSITAEGALTKDDEWFVLEVIARGNHLVTRVNGTQTADCRDPDARFSSGHIAFQALHPQTIVQFRKIEIKRLPSVESRLPATFKNAIGMEFVIVPKGKSWLGGGKDKLGDKEVEIKEDFYLGKYEVTQEEWEKVMGENPSHFSRTGDGSDAVKDISDADLRRFPVENMTWDQCQVFVAKLNQREKETGWAYRLPKEAEWEYACRGGPMSDKLDSAFDFYFAKPTNSMELEQANFNNGLIRTCKVGSYEANRLGLLDMHGNVWEWCDDRSDQNDQGTVRGGSWLDIGPGCWAGRGGGMAQTPRGHNHGLRLARVPSGVPSPSAKTPPFSVTPFTDADVKRIAALPAAEQIEEVRKELMKRNPGFDGKVEHKIEGGVVTEIKVVTDKVTDINPIRVFNALRVLDLSGTGAEGQPNGQLADLTPLKGMNFSSLTRLDLFHTKIDAAGLAYFKDCKNLKNIGLKYTKVSDAGLANFKDGKDLIGIDLGELQVTDQGLANFKKCKEMTDLWLNRTQMTDEGLAYFKDCKNLTILHAGGTQVTDAGLVHLKGCKQLTMLFLDYTKITDAGLLDLTGMDKLTLLHLEKTKVTAKGVEDLAKALPKCKITWDGGVIEPK